MSAVARRRGLQSASERNHPRVASHTLEPLELPDYEPPSCPLNIESIRELTRLANNKETRKYEEQLKRSLELLGDSVRDINDRYIARKETLKSLQERRGADGEKSDRERALEKSVLMLKEEVPQLSEACDHAVRSVIDLKIELEDYSTALKETALKAEVEAVQRRQSQAQNDDDDAAAPEVTGPIKLLQEAKDAAAAEYASKNLYEKYGINNDYIGFKRLWHDAAHGSDGKPLPDASKWFSRNGGEGEQDEDDDLIVAEEHMDIHCPLSMAVMKDPYTSKKCKHTFEKDSIVQFLRSQAGRRARCPQTGCNKEVSISDFQPDPIMLRKIKRQLAAQQQNNSDGEDDSGGEEGEEEEAAGDGSVKSEDEDEEMRDDDDEGDEEEEEEEEEEDDEDMV